MLPPRIDQAVVTRRIGAYADSQQTLEQRGGVYKELLGFVPPRIEARLHVTGALDPTMVDLQEKIREHGMYPKCFDVKTAQLMLFGMLLMDLNDAAPLHGIAARRAGASWEELQGVINLCFLFRGLSVVADLVDVTRLTRLAKAAGAKVAVDNTFLSPLLQKLIELGAQLRGVQEDKARLEERWLTVAEQCAG